MTTRRNPFTPGTYEHNYFNHLTHQRDLVQDRYDIALGEHPEARQMVKTLTERMVGEIEPDHGHLSIHAREQLRFREVRAIIAQENRGEMREAEPEPEMLAISAYHARGGLLRLRTDGHGWYLHIRGSDIGVGDVYEGEITPGRVQARPEILDAAADRALADPWGPEAPPDTPVFRGGPDGEPVETTYAALAEELEQQPDPSTVRRFRRASRLARRRARRD